MSQLDDLADLMSVGDKIEPLSPEERLARRRRIRRVWITVAVVVIVVVGSIAGYVGWALTAPLPAPVATTRTPTVSASAPVSLGLPSEGAAAIVVTGGAEYLGPDGLRLSSGTDEPRPIASISKLITALVVLDAKPLADAADPGPTITFDKAAHDLYDEYYVLGATVVAMPTGSSLTLHDALAAMLLPSASNYADAVASWAFGSRGGFLAATRAWLAKNALTGTTIVEPTGISPRNTSTPSDLLAIGALAAADPTISALTSMSSITLPGLDTLYNTNDLLGHNGITGLKTGNLGPGTFGLLFTASLDVGIGEPLAIIGVALGGQSRESLDAGVLRVLDDIRAGFHTVPVASAGTVIGSYDTAWGASAQLEVAQDAGILTWSDTPIAVTLDVAAPETYRDGEEVGGLTWTAGPRTVTVPVRVRGSIDPPDEWWRLTHPAILAGG